MDLLFVEIKWELNDSLCELFNLVHEDFHEQSEQINFIGSLTICIRIGNCPTIAGETQWLIYMRPYEY